MCYTIHPQEESCLMNELHSGSFNSASLQTLPLPSLLICSQFHSQPQAITGLFPVSIMFPFLEILTLLKEKLKAQKQSCSIPGLKRGTL